MATIEEVYLDHRLKHIEDKFTSIAAPKIIYHNRSPRLEPDMRLAPETVPLDQVYSKEGWYPWTPDGFMLGSVEGDCRVDNNDHIIDVWGPVHVYFMEVMY